MKKFLVTLLVLLGSVLLFGTCAILAQEGDDEGCETPDGVPMVICVTPEPQEDAEEGAEDCDLREDGDIVQENVVTPELIEVAPEAEDIFINGFRYGEGDDFTWSGESLGDVMWHAIETNFGGSDNHAEWDDYVLLVAPRYSDVVGDNRVSEADKHETDAAAEEAGFESVYFTGWFIELEASEAFWESDIQNLIMGEAPESRDDWGEDTLGYVGTAATLLFFKNRDETGLSIDADYLEVVFEDWAAERATWCEIDGE
jgi:hypothetical protein